MSNRKTIMERALESTFEFPNPHTMVVRNACIFWTNFAGAPTNANPVGGKCTFNLALNEVVADKLREEGWNIKTYIRPKQDPNDPDDIRIYTECVVKLDSNYPPTIARYSTHNGRKAVEDITTNRQLADLDKVNAERWDVVINYSRNKMGQFTYKGYVRELRVKERETVAYFEDEYADFTEISVPTTEELNVD